MKLKCLFCKYWPFSWCFMHKDICEFHVARGMPLKGWLHRFIHSRKVL